MNYHVGLLLCLFFSIAAQAADPEYNYYRDKGAIRGHDTVAYFSLEPGDKAVKGKAEFNHFWRGVTWYFANAENRKKFIVNPERYAPQYGGYCAFAVGKNFTTSIRPNSWAIIDGKLYLNHNKASQRLFLKNIDKSIALADANWPKVLKNCEHRGRCRKAESERKGRNRRESLVLQ